MTQFDPYHYSVDNRPLTDLAANDGHLANGVDAAVNSSTVHGYALSQLATGLFGAKNTFVADLTYPGGLQLTIKAGAFLRDIKALTTLVTNQVYKLGFVVADATYSLSGPGAVGFSRNHLIQVRYQDATAINTLPTFDANNERAPDTIVSGVCEIAVKSGAAAPTGTQVTPTPDSGWIAAFVVAIDSSTVNLSDLNIFQYNPAQPVYFKPGQAVGAGDVEIDSATETEEGIIEIATTAETVALTDDTKAVTPFKLAQLVASTIQRGIVELADSSETTTGTDNTRAVTPLRLKELLDGRLASTSATGLVELATNAETLAGTDATRAVTPAGVKYFFDNNAVSVPQATETVRGGAEVATTAEANAGTSDTTMITPLKLDQVLDARGVGGALPTATTTQAGIIEIAASSDVPTITAMNSVTTLAMTPALMSFILTSTDFFDGSETKKGQIRLANNSETNTGTDGTKAVSPLWLATYYRKKTDGAFGSTGVTGSTANFTGQVQAASFNATSSLRYKNSIEDISLERAVSIVKSSVGKRYRLNGDNSIHFGFIAEEAAGVIPEAVGINSDSQPESVAYDEYVPVHSVVLKHILDRLEILEGKGV